MNDPSIQTHAAQVQASLGAAWQFLTGCEREFVFTPAGTEALQRADFSFFMPLEIPAQARVAGVGVLMDRAAAEQVAAHMFGAPVDTLHEADLRDACSEACNVLSDSMALHMSGDADMNIGLPFEPCVAQFAHIMTHSTACALYGSQSGVSTLYVVVFYYLISS